MNLATPTAVDLIRQYRETGDITLRNKLIINYGDIVKYAALSLRNVYIKYAEVDDIINEGIIALIGAIDTFDFSRNVKFESYASMKVRGHIIDYIRKMDFIPRKIRTFAKQYDKAVNDLFNQSGREPDNKEIADYMNISEEKLLSLVSEAASSNTLSFEEMIYDNNVEITEDKDDSQWQAEIKLLSEERKNQLVKAINSLGEKERLVITLYYYEKLKFSDIAKVLDVGESRVCQIHSQAVKKLKESLIEYMKR